MKPPHNLPADFPQIDFDKAEQFLAALKGNDVICWQTFCDNKQKGTRGASIIHGPLEKMKTRLIEEQLKGRGIYVAVNRTDGRGRKTENVLAGTSMFVDGDDVPLPEVWPLEPHIITKRSNIRWQAFWLIEPTEDLAAWSALQKKIATCLGTDPKVCDPPRVMRVPGFIHLKGKPIRLELVKCPDIKESQSGRISLYTLEQIDQAFPGDVSASVVQAGHDATKKIEVCNTRKDQTPILDWDLDVNLQLAVSYLKQDAPPAILGQGNNTAFAVAANLKDLGISKGKALGLMMEHWNERCEPPWKRKELEKIVGNAYLYCQENAPGEASPLADFEALPPIEENPSQKAKKPKKEETKNSYKNALRMLRRADLALAYNEFTGRYFLTAAELPWAIDVGRELNDPVIRVIRHFLLEKFNFEVGKDHLHEAVMTLAREHPFHPVRDYLNGLEWDGTTRVDTWLIQYLGVEDTAYARGVGSKVLVGAVARIMQPGCKFDNIIVLEGLQGSGKSSAVKILAGKDWYSDAPLTRLDDADAVGQIQGVWLQELGEMVTQSKADIESLKAFASRAVDRARLPYERAPMDFPRQCIFIGTTNSSAYLRDQTGNRRFWPVKTRTIDLSQLGRDRDQLWAEATARFKQGEPWELVRHLWGDAAIEQEARLAEHPWVDRIRFHLEERQLDRVLTQELLNDCLDLPSGSQHQAASKNLREIMAQLGWKYTRGLRVNYGGKQRVGAGYIKDSTGQQP